MDELGLVLLTGGQGRRFGAPKHNQPHPSGGSWAGHLVRVFQAVCPEGPLWIVGEAVPEYPDLRRIDDPREGPVAALQAWSRAAVPEARRWWVAACDQVHWSPGALQAWLRSAQACDPEATAWVIARVQQHPQFLGSVLSHPLVPQLAGLQARSLWALAEQLPVCTVEAQGPEWQDVDTPADPAP